MPVCSDCMNEGQCTGYCKKTISKDEALAHALRMAKIFPDGWGAYAAGAKWANEMIKKAKEKK